MPVATCSFSNTMCVPMNPRWIVTLLAAAALVPGCASLKEKFGKKGDPDAEPGGEETVETPDATPEVTDADPLVAEFRQAAAARAAAATGSGVEGRDEWFFATSELAAIADRGQPGSSAYEGAVAAVVEYHEQLKDRGVQLVIVPVPPKAVLYPDELSPDWRLSSRKVRRLDPYLSALYAKLRSKGVAVIDPTPEMLEDRDAKTGRMFPKTHAAWSPRAAEKAAKMVADRIRDAEIIPDSLKKSGIGEAEATLPIDGGLSDGPPETVPARVITGTSDVSNAPLVVLGDAHSLAYKESGASFPQQLAHELRVTYDLQASEDGARNIPRQRLLRKSVISPGYLDPKKVVVWVVSGTEFYASDWRKIPAALQLRRSEEELQSTTPASPVASGLELPN